jgi:hypothetical protein
MSARRSCCDRQAARKKAAGFCGSILGGLIQSRAARRPGSEPVPVPACERGRANRRFHGLQAAGSRGIAGFRAARRHRPEAASSAIPPIGRHRRASCRALFTATSEGEAAQSVSSAAVTGIAVLSRSLKATAAIGAGEAGIAQSQIPRVNPHMRVRSQPAVRDRPHARAGLPLRRPIHTKNHRKRRDE